jgi:23S rRNA (uracil1939-C5)-methyltransferase
MSGIATSNAEAGATHSAEIESIAAGGAGVARLEGRVVFIPRTAPGDSVRFRISADKGKYLRGEIEEIASPGAARRDPPCPHWAECGGCPLLHLNPESQREAKRRIFLDALIRIGKIDPGVAAEDLAENLETPSSEFAYRMRVRFQVRGKAIGFFAPGTRRLVPVESCLMAEEPIAGALARIRALLMDEPASRGIESVEITSLGDDPAEGAGLFIHPPGKRDRGWGALQAETRRAWEAFSQRSGMPLAVSGDRGPGEAPAWVARYEVPGSGGGSAAIQVSPESFIQPNRGVNLALVRAVLEWAALPEGGRAVDLFSGAGNFALPLADGAARVVGVESSPFAVQDAVENARAAGRENLSFIRAQAEKIGAEEILKELRGAPDLVLLDPPRRGALETIPLALALGPRRIIYVSCNPATFARDAREITEGGYRMEAARIAPMFPNTAHVESVTIWTRESAPADTTKA